MNIAYATDENYIRHTYVSIQSLLDFNRDVEEINIYVIVYNVRNEYRNFLEDLAAGYSKGKSKRNIIFLNFEEMQRPLEHARMLNGSLLAYGRLFLVNYVDSDRILYIDSDTLINNSLTELYETEINQYAAAGVQDCGISLEHIKTIGLKNGSIYFNSGVCLFNLKYWRENNGLKQCVDYIEKYGENIIFHDQDVLNVVFENKILCIDMKYNVMSAVYFFPRKELMKINQYIQFYGEEEYCSAREKAVIIHFAGQYFLYAKPWYYHSGHPMAYLYKKYADKSPFPESLTKEKITKKKFTVRWIFNHIPGFMKIKVFKYL